MSLPTSEAKSLSLSMEDVVSEVVEDGGVEREEEEEEQPIPIPRSAPSPSLGIRMSKK